MAIIFPIRLWQHSAELGAEIDPMTSALIDVVSENQRTKFYQNPINSIHLSVPQPPDPGSDGCCVLPWHKSQPTFVQNNWCIPLQHHYEWRV